MPTQKRVIINTRERLVSTDINRMQAFSAAERAQFFAAVCADGPDYSIPTAISYPSTAIVVSGLLVRPYTGYCLIDGGSGLFPGALGDSDDFPVAFAASDGVTSTSVLPFVSNGLGVIRVDVFECRPLEVLDESSSRDIYDPLTGSFSAAVVDKVRSLKLEYRVRNGTPALDADSGWLPIAVAFVKPSDTGYDTADFYDVRPLLAERVWTSNRAGGRSVSRIDIDLYGSSTSLETGVEGFSSGAAYGFVAGCVEGETQGLQTNTPCTSSSEFGSTAWPDGGSLSRVALAASNSAPTVTSPSDYQLLTLYAVFPALSSAGPVLPRWRRYAQSGSREPVGPRGMLIWDLTSKSSASHTTQLYVSLPSHISGCLYSSVMGIVMGAGFWDSTNTCFYPSMGGSGWITVPLSAATLSASSLVDDGFGVIQTMTFPLLDTLDAIPPYCRGIDGTFQVYCDGGAGAYGVAAHCPLYLSWSVKGTLVRNHVGYYSFAVEVANSSSDGSYARARLGALPLKNGGTVRLSEVLIAKNGSVTYDRPSYNWNWDFANPAYNKIYIDRIKLF